MPDNPAELVELLALVLGVLLVTWGVWRVLGGARDDWERLRRWLDR